MSEEKDMGIALDINTVLEEYKREIHRLIDDNLMKNAYIRQLESIIQENLITEDENNENK